MAWLLSCPGIYFGRYPVRRRRMSGPKIEFVEVRSVWGACSHAFVFLALRPVTIVQDRLEREKKEAIEREKQRLHQTKMMLEQNAKLEEEQRKRQLAQLQKEKEVGVLSLTARKLEESARDLSGAQNAFWSIAAIFKAVVYGVSIYLSIYLFGPSKPLYNAFSLGSELFLFRAPRRDMKYHPFLLLTSACVYRSDHKHGETVPVHLHTRPPFCLTGAFHQQSVTSV